MNNSCKKILVVGQTPPPFGGQAIMIEKMLSGTYKKIELFHVRMAFSKEMDEIGKLKIFKIIHLPVVIFKIIYYRFRYNIDTLYYPPTGPNIIPFFRDSIILILTRPFFKNTCFHFHAGGISELHPTLPPFLKLLFKKAYFNVDLGIRLSENSPDDCVKLGVKKEHIVPNGIEDNYLNSHTVKTPNNICTILFVGLLSESKGLNILISACNILKNKGLNFSVYIMGKFESIEFEKKVKDRIVEYKLDKFITFLGVLTGAKKNEAYMNSDVFCFPSFFEAENFPVVLLEASSFSLPIVSTQWRGIPSIVVHDVSGFLAPIKDHSAIAGYLELLISDLELRTRMSAKGRERYLKKWTMAKFYENIENALSSI